MTPFVLRLCVHCTSTGQLASSCLKMFLNRASVIRFKAAWVPPCQSHTCFDQDYRQQPESVLTPQSHHLAAGVGHPGAGPAAPPAPTMTSPARTSTWKSWSWPHRAKYRRVGARSVVVLSAESMHEMITGSNPAVMHNFSNCFEIRMYAYIRVYSRIYANEIA